MAEYDKNQGPAEMQAYRLEEGALYFAYGSNMDLDQMEFRCPDAEVLGNARLEGYHLTFRGRKRKGGVATILPDEGSHVDGVLWKITGKCEESLDWYEGYPNLYGKEVIQVTGADGNAYQAMVYTMNAPYKDQPAIPSQLYLVGILKGCVQNGLSLEPIRAATKQVEKEVDERNVRTKKKNRER